MSIAGVVTCAHCHAVVNTAWQTCLACLYPLAIEGLHSGGDASGGSGEIDSVPFQIGETVSYQPSAPAQIAFDLNRGVNPAPPLFRTTRFAVGEKVTVHSSMIGKYESTVLREDGGVVLWVWHPILEREVAVPNEWISPCPE